MITATPTSAIPNVSRPEGSQRADIDLPATGDLTFCAAYLLAVTNTAKIWAVAQRELDKPEPPTSMPEYTLPGESRYQSTPASFWTSGFFPGSLYLIYERQRRWPSRTIQKPDIASLQRACKWWTEALHEQAHQKGTHDLGFLIQPWAQLAWELDEDVKSRDSLLVAARGLADRFEERVGAIRSWDTCFTKRYAFADPSKDFLVIIDNLMNRRLAEIATEHALTTLKSHVRADNSTCHVVNFDQGTGEIKERITNQGYSDESCWSRGQAWGITGFAQVYGWTKDPRFLAVSKRLADYFLRRLPQDGVPSWDFDAPGPNKPRDTSAAMVAAYGLILLAEADPLQSRKYLASALRLVESVCRLSFSKPEARFVGVSPSGVPISDVGGHDTILLNATINNYEFAPRRWADHGLVYADYYFLRIGNKLLEMGLL
ncbi:glycoside hydrolase family 88 protein [Moesziomyces aphidis]|uniref:Glycoside hydrolase family 88 protein n=1 Tax=Moesziomyces aphidis TaxID=84754 RepID=W3VSM1_MOEAP|nr:glycoside hydrolase family 88 protein [Moesziomyces aphidis]